MYREFLAHVQRGLQFRLFKTYLGLYEQSFGCSLPRWRQLSVGNQMSSVVSLGTEQVTEGTRNRFEPGAKRSLELRFSFDMQSWSFSSLLVV